MEIILTRIFSVTLWYHFSYMVISLAMFGIGFGGLLVYFYKDTFKLAVNENLAFLSLAQTISTVLALYASLNYLLPDSVAIQDILRFVLVYMLCTAPFIFCSMILSIMFLNWPERAAGIYSADLFGAAFGCIVCIILISYFSAPQVILIASFASTVAAIFFGWPQIRVFPLVALPSGIRFAQARFGDNIPWFWGLNGVSSVLGSIIAMAISMVFGYSFTLDLGAVFYLLALVIMLFIRPHQGIAVSKICAGQ